MSHASWVIAIVLVMVMVHEHYSASIINHKLNGPDHITWLVGNKPWLLDIMMLLSMAHDSWWLMMHTDKSSSSSLLLSDEVQFLKTGKPRLWTGACTGGTLLDRQRNLWKEQVPAMAMGLYLQKKHLHRLVWWRLAAWTSRRSWTSQCSEECSPAGHRMSARSSHQASCKMKHHPERPSKPPPLPPLQPKLS